MDKTQPKELHQLESDTGEMVFRNRNNSNQNATVSFGADWTNVKKSNVVEVLNYYKPNQRHQLFLPENSFFNSQGKVRPHVGGESTFRGDSVSNYNKHMTTHTNNYNFDRSPNMLDSDETENETMSPGSRSKGLFEVPFDVYSMPRLIAPFKGFSKIVTPRSVKLLTFIETEDGNLSCKVDKNSLKIIQKQVGNLNVVSISITGDPKSGKSFLGSLLVGKDNTSFNVSESFIDPNNMLTYGAVWAYVAVYQEKHAYLFFDFEGFEHSDKSRIKMLLFAFATSNLVLCNVKYSLMNGIYNCVKAMIHLTKKLVRNETLGEDYIDDDDEGEFLQIFRERGTRFMSKSYETKNFKDVIKSSESSSDETEIYRKNLWNPPIVQFIFRDCSGFVKCIDDRIYTPETLVEQGLFENYLDLFGSTEKDPNFKNEMLDSFELFTNRKYLSLPHPTLSTHPYNDIDYSEDEGLNLPDFFMKLLSTDKNDFKKLARFGYSDLSLNTHLSSIFYEKLDQLKSLLYHDTLNYAMAHTQLNGKMFGEYLKKLSHHFNKTNSFNVDTLNSLLSEVFLGENSNVLKESLLHFLSQIRSKVAPKLPLDPKELLNLAFSAKFSSLNYFESNAFGTPDEYRRQHDELSDTLEDLIRKLEDKNKSLMATQLANYMERKEAFIGLNILKKGYNVNDLDEDLSRLRKSLNAKFSHGELVSKMLARTSQNLVRLFNDTHPDTFVHNLSYSKCSSIEETFQSLNTDIISIASNLHKVPPVRKTPAYPGAEDTMSGRPVSTPKSGRQSDKLNSELEENDLDEEVENTESGIEIGVDAFFPGSINEVQETFAEGVGGTSEQKVENEMDEQTKVETGSQKENEKDVEEIGKDKKDFINEVEETDQKLDTESSEEVFVDFENSEQQSENSKTLEISQTSESREGSEVIETSRTNETKKTDETSEEQENPRNLSDDVWLMGESGGTRTFWEESKLSYQNSEAVYDEGEDQESKDDQLVQIVEDDFVTEDIDEPVDKQTVLKKIFQKSAEEFEKKGTRRVPL